VRVLSVLYGVGVVLASLVGVLLALLLLDYLLNLKAWPRVVMMLGGAALLGYVAWRWVIRPVLARMTINDIAGRVETAFPQFDDRLRSTVDFLAQQKRIPGSDAMKDRVVSETATLAGNLDMNRAIVARPAYLSMAGGVGAIALAVVLAAVGLMLVAILLDYLLNLPAVPRFVLVLMAVGVLGYVLFRWVIKPVLAKLTLSDVAGHLETAFPQFDDRLRSTVNFVRAGEHVGGSDAMKQRVMMEAGDLAKSLDLNRAIVMTPVWY